MSKVAQVTSSAMPGPLVLCSSCPAPPGAFSMSIRGSLARILWGGARYLRRLLAIFHGHLRLALEAYNAGPTTVAQGNIPIPAKVYARQVMALAA